MTFQALVVLVLTMNLTSCNFGKNSSSEPNQNADTSSTSSLFNGTETMADFDGEATTAELQIMLNNSELNCSSGDILSFDGENWSCSSIITNFQSTGITDDATSEAVTIDENGNVGIGTMAPSNKLSISGGGIEFTDTETFNRAIGGFDHNEKILFGSSNQMDFYTNNLPRISLFHNGNVGIGTTSPARKLHISDAMRLEPISSPPSSPTSGDIYFDDSEAVCMYVNGAWRVIEDGGSGGTCS